MVDKQIPVVDFSKPEYNVVQIKNETPERVDFNFRPVVQEKNVIVKSVSDLFIIFKYLISVAAVISDLILFLYVFGIMQFFIYFSYIIFLNQFCFIYCMFS